jgi:hypothetical protein
MTDTVPEAASNDPTPAPRPLAELLNDLERSETAIRLEAVQQLGRLEQTELQALRALEKRAAQDENPEVREAALQALAGQPYRLLQQQTNWKSPALRKSILAEIEQWLADGLLPDQIVRLLRQRYDFEVRPASTAALAPPAPRPSLTQILLSETTIQVALYLGAFFVVAAAFILAALFDVLRLPILGLATVGFLGSALGLKRRLPTASFVLFTVFSFLLPIDAGVLFDLVEISDRFAQPAWVLISGLLCLVWAGGTWLYRSRFFSLLTLAAGTLAMLLLGRWLDWSPHLDIFLMTLATLAGLGGTILLERWQDKRFRLPLLILAHIQQVGLLAISALGVLAILFDQDFPAAGWWVVIAGTWLLGAFFYDLSYRLTGFRLFPPLALAALLPAPLLLAGLFSPSLQVVMALAWVWATLLALAGEGLERIKVDGLRVYSPYLAPASIAVYLLAAAGGLADRVAFGMAYLAGTAIVYLGLSLYRPRGWLWLASLVAATSAYFAAFFLPSLENYNFYPGFILLWPALALLSLHLVLRRGLGSQKHWLWPPLLLGSLVGVITLQVLFWSGFEEPGRATICWVIIAGFLGLVSLVERKPIIGYGATTGLALALSSGLVWLDQPQWLLPLVGLASLFFLGGLGLALQGRWPDWGDMLRFSGLGLGALVSLGAPAQGGAGGVIGPAIIATYFAIEAFRRRNVWLAFPANGLYLIAYFTLLIELEVSQPQYYSVGAALLGFIIHYFLVRSGSNWGAFFTGLLSQVILLGTTYVQMFATEQILYFFVLFFQALVALGYGLVIRSRSLVLAPIAFVVLGVITVALSVLAGIPALVLVGCTGLLLLILGIMALVMREQLLAVTNRLGERLGGWQA